MTTPGMSHTEDAANKAASEAAISFACEMADADRGVSASLLDQRQATADLVENEAKTCCRMHEACGACPESK